MDGPREWPRACGAERAGEAAIHRAVLFKYLCDCVGLPCGIAAGDGDDGAPPVVYLRDEDALGADAPGPRAGDLIVDLSRPPFDTEVVR